MNNWFWCLSCFFMLVFMTIFPSTTVCAEEITLLQEEINVDTQLPGQIPVTVQVSIDREQSQDGNGSLRIEQQGEDSTFVPIREFSLSDVRGCIVEYSAWMSSGWGTRKSYLEMWCTVAGTDYFSKALDQSFSGEQKWLRVSTPFILKEGQQAEKAVVGVRFEGSGVVWIDQVQITRRALGSWGSGMVNWQWIPGTAFGCFAGLFGVFIGIMAPKGRARGVVMGVYYGFIGLSISMLVTGFVLWFMSNPYATWYAFLLPGFLGVIIFPAQYFTITNAYAQAEIRRLEAKDITER